MPSRGGKHRQAFPSQKPQVAAGNSLAAKAARAGKNGGFRLPKPGRPILTAARDAQAELLAILGIAIVAVVIAVLALQPGSLLSPPPTAVSTTQAAVKESVESYLRSTAVDVLNDLGDRGFSDSEDAVTFLGQERPYWYRNGQLSIPDASQQFRSRFLAVLNENSPALSQSLSEAYGDVSFGTATATATFRDASIDLTVNLPTTVKGYAVSQPYTISLPSRYGQLLRTAESIARAQASDRFLERFFFINIFTSPYQRGVQTTPTWLFLTRCGQSVFKTSLDVSPHLATALERTLAFTFLPGHAPEHRAELQGTFQSRFGDEAVVSSNTAALSAALPSLSQQTTSRTFVLPIDDQVIGANATFHLPDDYDLQFAMTPDPVVVTANPIGFTSVCQSPFVWVQYSARFPAVVRLTGDDGSRLVFALDAAMANNQPADFGSVIPSSLCADPQCSASLTAIGVDEAPVPGAAVSFLGCTLGITDSDGKLEAPAPCGAGTLIATAPGFTSLPEQRSSSDLRDARVLLLKDLNLRVHAYEAFIRDDGASYSLDATSIQPLALTGRATFTSLTRSGQSVTWDLTAETTQTLPADLYLVSLALLDENGQPLGAAIQRAFLNADLQDLTLVFPHPASFPVPATAQDLDATTQLATTLSSFLSKCSAGPVQEGAPSAPCSKAYSEV